jgi:hypothetical protein
MPGRPRKFPEDPRVDRAGAPSRDRGGDVRRAIVEGVVAVSVERLGAQALIASTVEDTTASTLGPR